MPQKSKEEMNKKIEAGFERFNMHIPKSNDMTLIILKGHLLVEQEINDSRPVFFYQDPPEPGKIDIVDPFLHRRQICLAAQGLYFSDEIFV